MINARRLANLTDEERDVYIDRCRDISIPEKEMESMKLDYTILGDGKKKYVLCECQRNVKNAPLPDYRGTGLALTGVLLRGETLEDFILHKTYMKPIIDSRVEEMLNFGNAIRQRKINRDKRAG